MDKVFVRSSKKHHDCPFFGQWEPDHCSVDRSVNSRVGCGRCDRKSPVCGPIGIYAYWIWIVLSIQTIIAAIVGQESLRLNAHWIRKIAV